MGKLSQICLRKHVSVITFFASQCTPLQTSSSLPTFCLITEETLSSLNISEDDIFAIIKNLNSINPMDKIKY